jgi:hypothetical protein
VLDFLDRLRCDADLREVSENIEEWKAGKIGMPLPMLFGNFVTACDDLLRLGLDLGLIAIQRLEYASIGGAQVIGNDELGVLLAARRIRHYIFSLEWSVIGSCYCAGQKSGHTATFLRYHGRRLGTVSPASVADCLMYRRSVLRCSMVVALLEGEGVVKWSRV